MSIDLRVVLPRSPHVELGGLVLFARTIDKARAKAAGTAGDYKTGPGLSAYLLEWLGLDEATLGAALAAHSDDDAMVRWLHTNTDAAIYPSINERLRIRALRDPEHRLTMTPAYPLLAERPDLSNWFEILDYDDALAFGLPAFTAPRRYVTFAGADGIAHGGIIAGPAVRAFPVDVGSFERFVALSPPERDAALVAVGLPQPLESVTLLAPVRPAKNVFCVGRNYLAHAEEAARARDVALDIPAVPAFFTKAPTTIIGPDTELHLDGEISAQYDWEAELAAIIGVRCRDLDSVSALSAVFGYTCLNDVTARDLQKAHQQWFKGKSLDESCPMGPWIVDARDIPDPQALDVTLRVNGEVKQHATTAAMIFSVPEILTSLSRGLTLEPGDVIATGTPERVGFARTPPEFLADGDRMEVEISGIGTLANIVRLRERVGVGAKTERAGAVR
jgi:2-keto-4-pentenoate hydratase/2-oxohepta-3-ene-1,7-dioic acid hydratase in catechol pathway